MKSNHLCTRARQRRAFLRPLVSALAVCTGLCTTAAAVSAATAALTISGKPALSISAGSTYSFRPAVTDSRTGRTLKFSIANKPVWGAFSASSGQLAGVPGAAGVYSHIVITVSDGISSVSLPAFAVTVTPDPVKITGAPARSVTAGSRYSFKPVASDSAGRTLSYSIRNKPAWASFSIASGLLSGTPLASQTGSFGGIVISASDGKASAALPAFAITVAAAHAATLAQKYPGDVGMGTDTAVVLYENFTAGSVAAILARYDNYKHPAGMSLVADHPADSPGTHALQLTAGGSTPATDFYKNFGAGYDELYFRYYIKYRGSGPWHHSGLWFGGYNPPLPYPYPHAGQRPLGNDRYSIALEPLGDPDPKMDFYVYWRGMHSWKAAPTGAVGDYYGNTFLHDAELLPESDTWVCYEIHLKLNPDPADGTGAVLQVWKNDTLVRTFDDTGPPGYWVRDKFCPHDADGQECTRYRGANPTLVLLDQRWRTTSALKINYFWPQNYNTASTNSSLLLDDMVVARQRVGCTVRK